MRCAPAALACLLLGASAVASGSEWSLAALDDAYDLDETPNPELDEDGRDGDGLRRDTMYFMGYQFAAVAILWAMPEEITGWSSSDKNEYSMSKWWNNVKNPEADSDDFIINYVIHPYWGASYYVRARERGYTGWESFWYSALLSTMFEFGAEALAEEPSYQDLIATPVLGSLVGIWFMDVREGIRERSEARGHKTTGEKWAWVLTDPLGAINGQMDKLFGKDVKVEFRPFVDATYVPPDPLARPDAMDPEFSFGLEFSLTW